MKKQKIKDVIFEYIKSNYDTKTPIFVSEIYGAFPELGKGTIRSIFKRLKESGKLEMISIGVYALPNKGSVLKKTTVYAYDVIERKYLRNEKGDIVGYISGINFANQIGLTNQNAIVETIYSNNVSNKKRVITIKNYKLIVNSPRVKVTNDNYKLLQLLDLLNDFEKYSEIDLKQASKKLLKYISIIKLDEKQIESVVSKYPLKAQVNFYKIGGYNIITQT